MKIPERITTISLKCKGIWYSVQIFELGHAVSITTDGGSCHCQYCEFRISPGPNDFLGVGINSGDYTDLSDDVKSSLHSWIPRQGVLSVIGFLCGKLHPSIENVILLLCNEDITIDPQKKDMFTFRERCRYDVLRVIKEVASCQESNAHITLEFIASSNLLSRIYDKEDIIQSVVYWSKNGILNHGTRAGYNIDLNKDRKILSLIDDYDWEEDTTDNKLHTGNSKEEKKYDVFICHSSEDKDSLVRPLAKALTDKGLNVWFDETTLKVGDRLRGEIDFGLRSSRYGIVVLSQSFFKKKAWTQYELDGLADMEVSGQKVILPIWHNVDHDTVAKYSHSLANRIAINSKDSIEKIVADLLEVIRPDE